MLDNLFSKILLLLLLVVICPTIGLAYAVQGDIHYQGSLQFEGTVFHRGDIIRFNGWSNTYKDGNPGKSQTPSGLFAVNIMGPDNKSVFEKNFTTDENGNVAFSLPITSNFQFGKYVVNYTLISKDGYDTNQYGNLKEFFVSREKNDIVEAKGYDFKLLPESSEIKYQSYPKTSISICPTPNVHNHEGFSDPYTGITVDASHGLVMYYLTKPDGTKINSDTYGTTLYGWFDADVCTDKTAGFNFYANMGGNWNAYAVAEWVSNGTLYRIQSNTISFHVTEPEFTAQVTKIANMTALGQGLDIDRDNKFVIFTTGTTNDKGQDINLLWTIHTDGTGLQKIDTGKNFQQITSPKISPSEDMILWSGAYYTDNIPVYGLFVYDIKENKLVQITNENQSPDSIGEFHWTHDNNIVYVAKKWDNTSHTLATSLVVDDYNGKVLNTTKTSDLSMFNPYRDPDHLGQMYVSVQGYQYSGGGAVSIKSIDGFEEKIFEIPNGGSYPVSAAISTDGKNIIFGYGNDGIYIAKLGKPVTEYKPVVQTTTTPVISQQNNTLHQKQSSVKFDSPVNLSSDGKAQNAKIVVSGNNIYAVWEDYSPGNSEIYFKKSTDGGKTFADKINVSNDIGRSYEPQILVSGNNVYIVWSDETKLTQANTNVLFVKSTDGGQTFSKPVNLSQDNAYSSATINWYPHIASSENNVYVMWIVSNYNWVNVFVAKSYDSGNLFGKPVNISNNENSDIVQLPSITASEKNVYVIWQDYFNNSRDPPYGYIKIAKSNNDGNSFDVKKLSENNGTRGLSSTEPHVYASGNNVYALWRDEVQEHGITLAKSTDSGNTFDKTYLITAGSLASDNPWKVGKNGNQYVIWDDWKDIFFAKSSGGISFSSPINLSNNTWSLNPYDEIPLPHIAVSGKNVFVTWKYTISPDGNHAPFFVSSDDGGNTFSDPINLSQSAGDSRENPQVAISGNSVYVVYSDVIPLGSDIFLVKGTSPQMSAEETEEPNVENNPPANIFEQLLNWLKQIFHFVIIGI
jgi:hypothetical protein